MIGMQGLVARYGGEEFAVLLPGRSSEAGRAVANRLCAAVYGANLPYDQRPDRVGRLSISVGVASTRSPQHRSAEAVIEAADRALYEAKTAGRNRVVADGRAGFVT